MSESVTLKSYFYEVLIPSSQKNTSSPIEDILHHVSISFMKKLALYKCFNPRTHTGCDGLFNSPTPSPLLRFQSTHPHGVRPSDGSVLICLERCFNPRTQPGCDAVITARFPGVRCSLPRTHTGCDPPKIAQFTAISGFQSTHPHGVRPQDQAAAPDSCVSIHAPTRGATVCKVTYYKSIN